jgi:drug/metabolite transporter (DMT)-like permease
MAARTALPGTTAINAMIRSRLREFIGSEPKGHLPCGAKAVDWDARDWRRLSAPSCNHQPMIGAFGTTLCFAFTAVFANRTAKLLGSTVANFWRLLLAALLLGAWAHLAGRGLHGASVGWFFVSGLAGFGVGGVAMFQSLPRLGSSLAMLIVQCGTVLVAVGVEWLWLGTRLTAVQIGFALLTLVGVIIGLLPRSLPAVPKGVLRAGVAWAVLSAAGQGLGAVLSRKAFALAAAAHQHPDPATTAYQRALGGLLVAVVAVLIERGWRRSAAQRSALEATVVCNSCYKQLSHMSGGARPVAWRVAWPWVLANVLTGPVLGVTCYQWALSTTPAGIVQPIVATSPLATIPLAAWLEGGWPRPVYYGGALLAVVGVAGLYVFH